MKKILELCGLLAAIVLVAFGIGAIVLGADGRDTVKESLAQEQIVGSPDMTPAAIKAEAAEAGLTGVDLPTCDIADEAIDTGDEARCFGEYMRVHALEATGGYTYAQMGQYEAKPNAPESELAEGGGTSNPEYAVTDPETGGPASNGARDIWVTETALATALNASYMADRMGLFGVVVGIALILTGLGFLVLVFTGAIRDPGTVLRFLRREREEAAARRVAKVTGPAAE